MTDIDETLRRNLSADDKAFLKDLEDGRGLFQQMGATFEGPMKGWTYLMFVFTFVFFALCVFAGWQAYIAEAAREAVLWSALALLFALGVAMLKLWMWERMNHLAILRELKKIELRVAQLRDGR